MDYMKGEGVVVDALYTHQQRERGCVLILVFCVSSCQSFDVFFPFAVRGLVA